MIEFDDLANTTEHNCTTHKENVFLTFEDSKKECEVLYKKEDSTINIIHIKIIESNKMLNDLEDYEDFCNEFKYL